MINIKLSVTTPFRVAIISSMVFIFACVASNYEFAKDPGPTDNEIGATYPNYEVTSIEYLEDCNYILNMYSHAEDVSIIMNIECDCQGDKATLCRVMNVERKE